jgi:hypothetical protein
MAYPEVSAPYGMVPVNLLGGQVYAGQTRDLPIGQNETTAIFYGDVVTLNASGNITKVDHGYRDHHRCFPRMHLYRP